MSRRQWKPVKAITLRRQVADALRAAILSGELQPGEKLKEVDLAERYGVSRNPIREAIGELEQQGLIVSEPNRGKTVVSPTDEELRQAYQVRVCLELLALRLVWHRITDDLLAQLNLLVAAMEETAAETGLSPLARHGRLNLLDAQFHGLLVNATGNRTLTRAWDTASPWALGFIRDLEQERHRAEAESHPPRDPHADLVGALARRDFEEARQALLGHVSRSWLRLVDDGVLVADLDWPMDDGIVGSKSGDHA